MSCKNSSIYDGLYSIEPSTNASMFLKLYASNTINLFQHILNYNEHLEGNLMVMSYVLLYLKQKISQRNK